MVGRGEGSPLYDPGSKFYYWEGESNASITINGMGKGKEVKCITDAVINCNNTIPKQVAPIDSTWTDCCCCCIIIKMEIYSSCEIEGFVETRLCKLCVIIRSRVLRVVCPH